MWCISFRSFYSFYFFFSSRRRHTRSDRDWSSDVCSSDLLKQLSEDERIVEIAEMLSGKNISDSALTHARELLN